MGERACILFPLTHFVIGRRLSLDACTRSGGTL